MRGFFLAALAGVASAALSPISRKGAYLFDSSGARFYLKVGGTTDLSDARRD
jgi:hypothetical protein